VFETVLLVLLPNKALSSVFLLQPVEDPEGMTEIIVQALSKTSQRGIIDKGWGGIGKCKSHNIRALKAYIY
jgi:hypothetical protein